MKDLKVLLFGGFLVILLFVLRMKEGFQSSREDIMKNPKKVFALFYMKGCKHCDDLKPIWDKVEAKYGDKMTSIDSTEGNAPFGINGFPTMLVVENGKVMDTYNGGRTEEELSNYVKNNL